MLELLVVIVLITLVTSFTIPTIRTSLFTDQLKSTTRRLVGFFSEVSLDAISNQVEYQVGFDLEKNEVWSASPGQGLEEDEEEKGRKRLEIPDDIAIVDVSSVYSGKNSAGTVELYFSKKGYVEKTAIHLRSDDGREMTVILSPFMGVARVFDSYVEVGDDLAGL